jgi:DNA-binding SARP family transcriptional activator
MLQVRMFGSIEVVDPDGGRVLGPRDLGGKKPRQLLEILLLERGRRVSKQRLADLLWADNPPQNYSATVESYISVLRRTLSPGGAPRDSLILTDHGGYRFANERARVDLDLFDDLLAKCDTDEAQVAMERLAEAIELVQGELLEDDPYAEWVQDAREAHMPRLMGALVSAGECALTLGESVRALRFAERALNRDPLVEAASRIAMVASYRLGRQEDAVRAFHRCRETLAEELGVTPMPDTVSLYMAIERHDETLMHSGSLQGTRDDGPACVFLGRSHELGDLEEHVAHALSGAFSLVLVEGEGGIGTTRFLEEAQRRVMGPHSGRADCSAPDAAHNQLPLIVALESALGADEEVAAVRRAFEQLVSRDSGSFTGDHIVAFELLSVLVRRRAPLVLFIDRLDLSNRLTVSALGYMQRRCSGAPVAVVATCRPGAAGEGALALLEPVGNIRLEALRREDLSAVGLGSLYDATAGHPLLLSHAVRGSFDEEPAGLGPDLCRRLAGYCAELGPEGLAALEAAAALPQPFAVEALAAVLDVDALELVEDLELMCEAHVLHGTEEGFGFRYDAVRAALEATAAQAGVIDLRSQSGSEVEGGDATLAAAS